MTEKMNKHAAAVMWTNPGITERTSKTIVCHLTHAFGGKVQVPIYQVKEVEQGYVIPKFR